MWAGERPENESAPQVDDGVIASLHAMQAPPEVIAEWEAARTPPPPEFEIHADNWEVFLLFTRRLGSQWQIAAGMGGVMRIGIPLQAIESLFRLLRLPHATRLQYLDEIQIMEAAALEVFNNVEGS